MCLFICLSCHTSFFHQNSWIHSETLSIGWHPSTLVFHAKDLAEIAVWSASAGHRIHVGKEIFVMSILLCLRNDVRERHSYCGMLIERLCHLSNGNAADNLEWSFNVIFATAKFSGPICQKIQYMSHYLTPMHSTGLKIKNVIFMLCSHCCKIVRPFQLWISTLGQRKLFCPVVVG